MPGLVLLLEENGQGCRPQGGAQEIIFLSSDTGKTIIYKPGENPGLVASNELEGFRSTPVFEGTRMYVRGLEHLCIGR